MYARLKPLLFQLDAEQAHHLTMTACAVAGHVPALPALLGALTRPVAGQLSQNLWGLSFASPIGLAAGLDKNAEAVGLFSNLGFGFLEVGTVTPRPQMGNEQPRLFRLPSDEALINRMGFNNLGLETLERRLRGRHAVPIWANIGKNKDTLNEQAADDYRAAVRALYGVADGFVINVSSPNTPGLRALQHAGELHTLVSAVLDMAEEQRLKTLKPKLPILVKLSPDLDERDFEASVDAVERAGASGLILSNTTLSREGLSHSSKSEIGGLSGKPLTRRSTELVKQAYRQTGGTLPIVGVGGVFTAEDAYAKIRAGASLVEVYTALIYEGPALPSRLNTGLLGLLRRDGLTHISEAVGVDA
ncbi:quinone-dependent dihydroorotate dehydrogenase [Deinococcus detaillensis]|uniref:Dihydroorotate dehydrogenase (quinone) n=1 Tax=Deinococcus detaillensis TaxID=2592048 RepID=A0A553V2L9_9DEIO|nr:quinone-dependent dihydroorotate dehydrogenase [Deinococcus detaillensis]TSA86706.1 quinone-dependent dihydroorotate dehydrogenase [Deinococcus detaillensis]